MTVLLWGLVPLALGILIPSDLPLLTLRAAAPLAAAWLVLTALAWGAALLLAGWNGVRLRTRGLVWLAAIAIGVGLPTLLSINRPLKLVTVSAAHPLALGWGVLALAGMALMLVRAGGLMSESYRLFRNRDHIFSVARDHISEAIALYDDRLRLLWANSAAQHIFYRQQALKPEVTRLLERAAANHRRMSQSLGVSETARVNVQATPHDGGIVSLVATPAHNDSAAFYERFIRRTVHDMRNPLAAIIAHTSNLQNAPEIDREAVRRTAETVEGEAQRLTRLVDSMLFDARLSYVPLSPEKLDLRDVIEDVFLQYDERAVRDDKLLEMDVPPDAAPLEADRDLLVRALGNLVDNSLKYSPPSATVRLMLEICPDRYVLQVVDDGDGIPPDYLPDRIFDALVRARPRDGGGGSGLGLSIVRKIVEMHGGTIKAASVLGEGTAMTITLPR